ncbi:MAG: zinc-binding dehydrogenase [Candidatus Bathyarchaeia archaeon]
MKAKVAVFTGAKRPFEIREYDLPQVEDGAVLVKLSMANLCGSDVHMWRGESPFPVGMVGGHEMTGRVARLGKEIKSDSTGKPLKEGDRVIYPYFMFCGTCRPCLNGRRTVCQNKLKYWNAPADIPPHFRGAYGEYYYSPPGNPIFKVPDSLPDEIVAPANCALSQVIFGLEEASLRVGDSVVVQGAGGLGIFCTAVAKDMGAGLVIVIDRYQDRLQLAGGFGADVTLNLSEFSDSKDLVYRIRKLTDGQGADVVMGLGGHPSTVPDGLRMLAPGGRLVEIGNVGIGPTAPIDPGYMVLKGLTLKTAVTYEPWALKAALDFLERNVNRLPFDRILSHKFPFKKINEAFERADRGDCLRATLTFD